MEQTPIIIRIEEAKQELIQCTNSILQKYELNCYLIEPIIEKLYSQIQLLSREELKHAKEQINIAKNTKLEDKQNEST